MTEVSRRPVTAGQIFKASMNELIDNLKQKVPFYVRCIKPNADKSPSKFDEQVVSHQVEYLGLVENVRVRRAGFAYRAEYDRFLKRYKMISGKTWPNYYGSGGSQMACREIVNEKGFDGDVKYGKTKLFIRSPQTIVKLEQDREYYLSLIIVLLQKVNITDDNIIIRINNNQQLNNNYLRNQVWRGTLVRMRMKKIRAAMAITQYYRRYKLRMYLQSLVAIGVETRRLYQHKQPINAQQRASLENWPTPPKTLANVVATIRRVYRRWKAWLLLRRIPRETWPEFRLKVIAAGALSGKRVNYGLSDKWHGNYLAMSEFNAGNSNVFENSIRQKLPPNQTVLFSSRIVKASNSLFKKSADRLVILFTLIFFVI